MSKIKRPAPRAPWDSPQLEPGEIAALKALRDGVANQGQQQIAFTTIMHHIAGVDRLSFYAGDDQGRRATDFAEGRRWVGLMIREACNIVPPVNPRGAEPAMPDQGE